jgi:pimeloyl-ACP methyl ester carboxylesterase
MSERSGAPGGVLEVIPDAAHALPYDDPEAFASVIRTMLASITPPAQRAHAS